MKQLFAYSLLFCFMVLLAPRDFFHDCDHGDQTEQTTSHGEHDNDADCSICDYDISPAEKPESFLFDLPVNKYIDLADVLFEPPSTKSFTSHLHRGPPVVAA